MVRCPRCNAPYRVAVTGLAEHAPEVEVSCAACKTKGTWRLEEAVARAINDGNASAYAAERYRLAVTRAALKADVA